LPQGVFAGNLPLSLGRSQEVRQRILIPPFGGSNPPAPAPPGLTQPSRGNQPSSSSRTSSIYRNVNVAVREYQTLRHIELNMELLRHRDLLSNQSQYCLLQVDVAGNQVDFAHGRLHVNRAKKGLASVHPLGGEEIRAFRRVKREAGESRYIFVIGRDGLMTTAAFAKCWRAAARRAVSHFRFTRTYSGTRPVETGEPRRRHLLVASLSRPQEHPAHDATPNSPLIGSRISGAIDRAGPPASSARPNR
jgi:hypothetical protein